jgi:PAS domain S-box-containing protein
MTALAHISALTLDCDGRITAWPDAARDMFGRTADEAVGRPLTLLIEPRQRTACTNVMDHLCRDTRAGAVHTMELVALHADGSTFPIECSLWRPLAALHPDAGFDGLIRDISHRVRVEQELRDDLRDVRRRSAQQIDELQRSQARFMDIADTIDEVFWMADARITRMLYISPGYERIWGRPCASLYDDPRSFIDAIHPDDRARVAADLLAHDGLPFDHEYRIVDAQGTERWIWDRGFPVRNAAGEVDRYIGVAQDVSVRKAAEAALRRQETIDAIGQMTGGLAHDFNNVLSVVVGHLDLIGRSLPEASPAHDSVARALDAALRGSRLARRLLALARREPIERRIVGLTSTVRELEPLLQYAVGPDSELVITATGDPHVCIDSGDLDAALINLAVNARTAMPAGGRLTLTIGDVDLVSPVPDVVLPPGRYASLDVSDTGCGMDEGVLRRLGEPFFTTRPQREGIGLGVSMVHAFVRQSGGALRVESTPGEGSCFHILLPLVDAPTGDATRGEAPGVPGANGEPSPSAPDDPTSTG